jgi:hypothetical protein
MSSVTYRETLETKRDSSEKPGSRYEAIIHLGDLAIKRSELGINDSLTHLRDFLIRGNEALTGIQLDLETDIAERLKKAPFVNQVDYDFTGQDFVSAKDKVSMDSMTQANLQILREDLPKNPGLQQEYDRAEVEVTEVDKLAEWFKSAPIGGYAIFESLPIGNQKFAIPRIYRKADNGRLEGRFISLYSSSIEQFNTFHDVLNIDVPHSQNETKMLDNNYAFFNPGLTNFEDFTQFYVGTYDRILQIRDKEKYSFGIKVDKTEEKKNGIEMVRRQPRQTAIYIDTVKALAKSNGKITTELITATRGTETGRSLKNGQPLTTYLARNILSETIKGIASFIDNASEEQKNDLENGNLSDGANYSAMAFYGEQAKASGETYDSGGCSEYSRSSAESTNTSSEMSSMLRAFGIYDLPENFGKPKMGKCIIPNCPTHNSNKDELIGGCGICVNCHNAFLQGKNPEKEYQIAAEKVATRKRNQIKKNRSAKEIQDKTKKSKLLLKDLKIKTNKLKH